MGQKVVMHGGWNGEEVLNDTWIFNTESFSWMQPKTAGFGPTARYGHTMTLTQDGRLLIVGGCSIDETTGVPKYNDDIRLLDTDTMVWSRPRIGGHIPTGRYGHSSTLMENGMLVVYGGWGKGGCQSRDLINDSRAYTAQILDTKTMTWLVPHKLGRKEAKHVYNHGCYRASSSSILLFGGFDGRQALNNFFVINVDTSGGDI